MGAFNTLITDITCENCQKVFSGHLQFKFGHTWQYEYHISDLIKWGGNDIGLPASPKVKVYGILEEDVCPVCTRAIHEIDFDIVIESDIIKYVTPMSDARDYDLTEGTYMILEGV